jgi:hypothetical protein
MYLSYHGPCKRGFLSQNFRDADCSLAGLFRRGAVCCAKATGLQESDQLHSVRPSVLVLGDIVDGHKGGIGTILVIEHYWGHKAYCPTLYHICHGLLRARTTCS